MMRVLHEHLNRMELMPVNKSLDFRRSIISHKKASIALIERFE